MDYPKVCSVRTNLLLSEPSDRKQELLLFVLVISPAAHDDRDVSRALWLTEDRSTLRSIVRNGSPWPF